MVFPALDRLDAETIDISAIRINSIKRIIGQFVAEKENLRDFLVQEAILGAVGREMLLEPKEEIFTKKLADIASDVRKIVHKRFPVSIKNVKLKATEEAVKKYILKDKLEFVTVKILQGRRSSVVSGIFYRFGLGGNSVVIGDHTPIAFIDLVDTDRAKFDKVFCAKIRKEYIAKKVKIYSKRKQSLMNKYFTEEREKVVTTNINLGYLYVWNKWRTPKEVAEIIIKQEIRKMPEVVTADVNAEGLPDLVDASGEDFGTEPEAPDGVDAYAKIALEVAKLKQNIEKKQMEISGSQYGIDADHSFTKGDLVVLLGLTHDEVNLLTGLKGEGVTATLSYPKGKIDRVIFSFINNLLYKIEVIYRIGPAEAMELLWDSIKDNYGDSTEMVEAGEKEHERQTRLQAIRNLCKKDKKGKDTHKWAKNKICTKCGVRQADLTEPIIEKDIQLTWSGKMIIAKLLISLTDDKLKFTKFVLIKENILIKEEQEGILEGKRLREMEEDRLRRIEEFKNN